MVALGGIRTSTGARYTMVAGDFDRLAAVSRWRVLTVVGMLRREWPRERWSERYAPAEGSAEREAWERALDSRLRYVRRRLRLYATTLPRPLVVPVASVDRGRVYAAGPGLPLVGLPAGGIVSPFMAPHALACAEVGRRLETWGATVATERDIRRAVSERGEPVVASLAAQTDRGPDGAVWPDLGVPSQHIAVEVERMRSRPLAHYRARLQAYAFAPDCSVTRVLYVCETHGIERRVLAALDGAELGDLDVVVVAADTALGWWRVALSRDVWERWFRSADVAA